MAISRALFSSARTRWETPMALFRALDHEFSFTLDVCATPLNRKCLRHFTRAQNALRQRWTGVCWMNPPYGRAISAWILKAYQESARGAVIVCLLPARTDTSWWHDYVMRANEIRFLRGRVTFVGARGTAPFPSAVVLFKKSSRKFVVPRVVAWDWRKALTHSQAQAA
jgi:site-specific DNA-methyltransferase (adenine-specific)